jgi:beta-glucosidase
VTLYHLDFPQILEDEYHGWLSPRVIDDFTAYADVCFREFGDRVRHWTTMDEPNVLSIAAYDSGAFPPCRCSPPFGANCTAGNSTVEPYVVAHNSILAHASVTRLYRDKYQVSQSSTVISSYFRLNSAKKNEWLKFGANLFQFQFLAFGEF